MTEIARPKLVAETDESGKVTHVWLSMPDWKFARPMAGNALKDSVLAASETYGASRAEIAAWVRQRGSN
ncbi:MAG: hypothetical protein AAGP08_00615 [Pseudomonadota bacterium]